MTDAKINAVAQHMKQGETYYWGDLHRICPDTKLHDRAQDYREGLLIPITRAMDTADLLYLKSLL